VSERERQWVAHANRQNGCSCDDCRVNWDAAWDAREAEVEALKRRVAELEPLREAIGRLAKENAALRARLGDATPTGDAGAPETR
jgi:hypothetical protein